MGKQRATQRDPLQALRLQAILAATLALVAASAIPAVEYGLVFQYSELVLGPQAWGHWGVVLLASAAGILAHGLASSVLTALHAALGFMLAAALGGYNTAFWYTLDTRCQTSQVAFAGCAGCTCAQTNSCSSTDLGSSGSCAGCSAYPAEICSKVLEQKNKYLLAFTGLATVITLAIPACYSLVVLVRAERAAAERTSKRECVAFAVDQQSCLVQSGDKPTVTPAMLAEWVGFLLDSGDPHSEQIAEKCRKALSDRGFDLPIVRRSSSKKGKKKKKSEASISDGTEEAPTPAAAATMPLRPASGKSLSQGIPLTAAGGSLVPPAVSALPGDDAAVSYPDIEAGSNSFRRTAKVAADDVPSLYPQVP